MANNPIAPTIASFDLVLSDSTAARDRGLMVFKDLKTGVPLLRRYYLPSLSPQQFQSLSEASFPPEYQVFVTQEEWDGGFGKQKGANKGHYYQQSFGTDASYKRLIIPGPVAVASTKSTPTYASTATIANGGFEAGNMSSWTTVTGSPVAQNTLARTGTWAMEEDIGTAWEIKQTITAADASLFNGMTLTFSAYGQSSNGADTRNLQIILETNAGLVLETGAAVNCPNGSWTEATCVHTFTDGYVGLVVRVLGNAGGAASLMRVDDITVTVTGSIATAADMGTIVKLIEFNTAHYAVSETGVWKRSANNWVRVAGSPDAITDAATDGTSLYLARGTTKNYWYMDSSATPVFTRNTGSGASSQPIKMAWIAGSMYGTDDPQTVWKYNALASGGTSNTYTVGDTGYNITSILDHLSTPTILKENAGAQINSAGTVVVIASELRSMFNTNTGKQAVEWWGNLHFPAGNQTLWEYDAGTMLSIGPSRYAERLGNFGGQPVALAFDEDWLFCVLDNTTKIEILKGRRETVAGTTDFRWHPFFEDTYATVSYAMVSTITAKRLWYGGGTALPKYIPLSTQYADPLTDTNLSFKTATYHHTPWYDFGMPNVPKTMMSFELEGANLNANRTITVEYNLLGETAWTELGGGGNGVFNTLPTQTKAFATGVSSRAIQFRFTFTTNDSAVGLGIVRWTCRAVMNPTRLEVVEGTILLGDAIVNKTGKIDNTQTYQDVASQLHSWADTHPLTLTIPDGTKTGTSLVGKFAEGYPVERFLEFGDGETPRPRSLLDFKFVVTPST